MRRTTANEGAPRRHPQDGGYARGEETRSRIIATALRIFGEQGYIQASTRSIATGAGVNPPALQYYFGGKEGLHRACGQHIIDQVGARLSPALDTARGVRAGSRSQAVEALCELLTAMAWGLAVPGSESWSRFVNRSKADGEGPAIAMFHECIFLPVMEAAVRLVGIATGRPPGDPATQLRALAILGQVTSIYANRALILRLLNWPSFDERALALIKSVVSGHTRAALAAPEPVTAPHPGAPPDRTAAPGTRRAAARRRSQARNRGARPAAQRSR